MITRTTTVGAIAVVALAAIGVISAVTIQGSYDANLNTERSRLAATAQVTAELMSQQMTGVEDVERSTVGRASLTAINPANPASFDTAQIQSVLNQVQGLRPEFQFAALADDQGTARATAPADPKDIAQGLAFRDWFRGVMRTGQTYVSSADASTNGSDPLVVTVATPVRAPVPGISPATKPTGRMIGVLYIGYKIGSVQAFIDRLAALQHIDLQLTDQAGVVMAQRGGISAHLTSAAGNFLVASALAGRATTLTTATTVAAAVPIAGLGWTISASTPASATSAAGQRNASALIATGMLVALGLAAVFLVIATGRLERAKTRHAASATELRTVHHALTEAIQVFDSHGALVSRNTGAEHIFAVDDSDWTPNAFDSRWELLREDGSLMPAEQRPVAVAMRSGESSERVVVGIRSRTDARVKWLSVSTVPIRGANAEISGYVCCSHDVTERIETIRELDVISRAAQLLSASLKPEHVIRALTTSAAELCSAPGEPVRRAQLFLIDGEGMTMTGEYDPEGDLRSEGASLPIAEHPYIERVIATGEAVMAELDYDEFGPTVGELMRRAEIRNCVWAPIKRRQKVVAVLAVAGRQHALIAPAQLTRLKTLATIGELALSNADALELAAQLAQTDPLTGVANRRALDDRLARLPRLRFAIVAIDIDDLKKVNDAYGHDAGDELLVRVAAAMAVEVRPGDLLARTGGDEFTALLINCDAGGAAELGRRLGAAVAQLRFPWGAAAVSVGVAAGVAGVEPAAVAKAADQALYVAKGRLKGRGPAALAGTTARA